MNEEVRMEDKVSLKNTIMIIGLSGWGNAGEVSTFTVKYLVDNLCARKFGEISSETFNDYFIQRPIVSIKKGVIQSYSPLRNVLYYSKRKEKDLVLLLGCEPHLKWPRYVKTVLKLAKETDVTRIYTLGGYLADVSSEDELIMTVSTNNERLMSELQKVEVEFTNYQGPTSVYSELMWTARELQIDVVSLWCAVPVYVIGLYPKAAYAILMKISQLTGLKIDLEDIKIKMESFKVKFEKQGEDYLQLQRRMEKEPSYIF